MKKNFLFVFLLTILSILTFSQQIPEQLIPYITDIQTPSKYIELKAPDWNNINIPELMTKDQAMEDIRIFEYIVTQGYSGYDYWTNQGRDFEKAFSELRSYIEKSPDTFETWKLEKAIVETLYSLNIIDGHLSVRGYNLSRFFNHKSAYFSEIILEKNGTDIIVKESNFSNINPGDIYKDKEEYLFSTLSNEDTENYIIGVLSYNPVVVKDIIFSSGKFSIPFHSCRISEADVSNDIFTERKIMNTPVISVRSMSNKYYNTLKEFEKTGNKYRNSENIILDILYNGGGSSDYGKNFIKNLNRTAVWQMNFAQLESPVTLQAWALMDISQNPTLEEYIKNAREKLKEHQKKPYRKFNIFESPKPEYGDYKGNLFVLTNRNIASSGEALCSYARSVKKSFLIGENTAGIGTFGEIDNYQLPNSNIILNVPEKLFVHTNLIESIGFMPDYWLDSPTPIEELIRYIKFRENYSFTYSDLKIPTLENIDMEIWKNNIPEGLNIGDGAFTGDKNNNIIKRFNRDNDNSCIEITGNIDTGIWKSLNRKIPHGIQDLTVSYEVSGKDLKKEGNQFENCYIGFIYYTKDGKRKFKVNPYSGTFDWKKDTIKLSEPDGVYNATMTIFSSISGSLFVDNIDFN
jgi:hypothetical protein